MERKKTKEQTNPSRRKFLINVGITLASGSFVVAAGGCQPIRRFIADFASEMDLPSGVKEWHPDYWFEINEDNTISMFSPKIEMGQGTLTGFAMMVAEELDLNLDMVKVHHAETSSGLTDGFATGGSTSTGSMYLPLRTTAATLAGMLKNAAAKIWALESTESFLLEDAHVLNGTDALSFHEINLKTTDWEVPKKPKLKDPKNFKVIGRGFRRSDLKDKVLGKPIYAIDQAYPNMLEAVVLSSPYLESSIKKANTSKAAFLEDVVKIVRTETWIGVIAKNRYAAEMAKRMIEVEWDIPKKWQQDEVLSLVEVGKGKAVNIQNDGNAKKVFEEEEIEYQVIERSYRTPFGSHAQMEPNVVIADYTADKITIVTGTQGPEIIRNWVAKEFNFKKDKVNVIPTFLGGGFGNPYTQHSEAVQLSKAVGRPVKVVATREQEFQSAHHRPCTHHEFKVAIGAGKKIKAITHNQAFGDMVLEAIPLVKKLLGADFVSAGHGARILYDIEHRNTTVWHNKTPLKTSIWRGVGCFPNGFAVETFMDEIAVETGQDPFEMRLSYLRKSKDELHQRMKRVLETLREKCNWENIPLEDKVGQGIALFEDRKTVVAAMVEVVAVAGKIKVKKVYHVSNPAIVVNREGAKQQVEGSIMMGISASMYEKITVKDGQIEQSNYHQYPMATLADCPEMEVYLLEDEGAERPYGMGEPPLSVIAPAIGNAIFNLTGKRQRSLPFVLEV